MKQLTDNRLIFILNQEKEACLIEVSMLKEEVSRRLKQVECTSCFQIKGNYTVH